MNPYELLRATVDALELTPALTKRYRRPCAARLAHFIRTEPSDLRGDLALYIGFAIAGHECPPSPGWIPEVQRRAVEYAELAERHRQALTSEPCGQGRERSRPHPQSLGNATNAGEWTMTKMASDAVIRDAAAFVRFCRRSAREWERGNNSGDPDELARAVQASDDLRREAERIAGRYGCRCTWPGLYPVLERGEGPEEYASGDATRVARFFAEGRS